MNWDEYYLEVCNKIAKNSKCLSRKIGAIIVKDKIIVVTGYNGPPKGIPHCGLDRWEKDYELRQLIPTKTSIEDIANKCPRQILGAKSGEMLELCPAAHAERNCISSAAMQGINTKGSTMYMNCNIPCSPCLGAIINAGILEIVCINKEPYDNLSKFILKNAELKVRTYAIKKASSC